MAGAVTGADVFRRSPDADDLQIQNDLRRSIMQAITTESLLASVRSFVPGRLRLRHPALAELSDDLADGLVA